VRKQLARGPTDDASPPQNFEEKIAEMATELCISAPSPSYFWRGEDDRW
jgi:hypothetical protein